jgi:AcrR family transcriptional regulator
MTGAMMTGKHTFTPVKRRRGGTQPLPLSRDDILAAALPLLARDGVDGLTLRAVADQIGTSSAALYHYFSGRDDLIDRLCELVAAQVDVTVDASAPWDDGVVAVLSSMQRTFAEYPGVGTRVLTTRRPSPVADRIASVVRERLLVGGLDDAAADRLLTALRVYFAGWLLGPPRAEPRALDPELLEQSVRWLMHGCVEFERGPADMGTGAR